MGTGAVSPPPATPAPAAPATPPPPLRLRLVHLTRSQDRIRPEDQVEDVRQAVRGVDAPVVVRFEADAEAAGGGGEGVDGGLGGGVGWAGGAEFRLVPEVDAGLVAEFDLGGEVGEEGAGGADGAVLGLVGEVGGVVVEEVVVLDALFGWAAGGDVPDGLEEAAGGEVPAGEGEGGGAVEDGEEGGVVGQGGAEGGELSVQGQSADHPVGVARPRCSRESAGGVRGGGAGVSGCAGSPGRRRWGRRRGRASGW